MDARSGTPHMNEWLSPGTGLGVLGVLGGLYAWLSRWREGEVRSDAQTTAGVSALEEKDDGLRQAIRELRDEFRAGVGDLQRQAVATTALQASQNKVNEYTAKAIESITARQEKHEEKLNDHAATLRLVTELLTRDQNSRDRRL